MNKIKDIFSPGHAQDADLLYGSQQSANTGRLSGEGSHFGNARDDTAGIASTAKGHNRSDTMDPADPSSTTTASDTAAERGQGFARQTVNPDEGRAESAGAAATALPDRTAGGIHSTPVAEKDTSRRQQIVNPEDCKYDNSGTLEPTPTRFSKESGLEPVGGVSRSSEHGQGIVGAQSATGNLRPSKFADKDDVSVASVRSGVIGDTPHAKELTDTDLPVGAHDTSKSGHGIGPGAAAAAAGTAAALGSTTERSFPLSGGTTTETSGTRGDYPSRDEPSTLGRSTEAPTFGVTTGTHRSGYDRSGLAAAAASTAFDNHKHGGRYHEYEGPNTDTTTSGPTFTSGPHATETANRLDPNLPSPNLPSSSMPGAYPDSAAATPASEVPSTTTTTGPSSHEHHYGRDAAMAGAGAATAGALYEARSRETAGPEPVRAADRTQRISSQDYGQDTAMAGAGTAAARGMHETHHREPTEAVSAPKSETVRDAPSQEHHYGRDAAIAGAGAAAAGGLYEARRKGSTETDPATKTHGPHKSNVANIVDPRVLPDPDKMKGHHAQSTETDPASKTVGPHSSNIANVLDPRVLPQPEKMKQHTTAGPHQSDSLNRMDPRVDSDPAKEANQHHYGRDAAIAGGLGAGAAGAYAASQQHSEKNPYTSHAVDPRVHSSSTASETPARTASKKGGWFAGPVGSAVDNNKTPATTTVPTGTTGHNGSSTAQSGQQHHYGRDAAVAGGAGLAGAGIAHQYGEHKADRATAQDHASGTTGTSGPYSSSHAQQPQTTSTSQSTSQHHHGREPAVAGAVGATAYEYQRAEAQKAEQAHPYGTTTSPTGEQVRSSTDPARTSADSDKKHHYGRDAAVAGAAGAAVVGAAHEFSKHDAEKAEKEHLKEQKALEKEEKKHQKELEKEEKKEEKEHEKEEKKHQKELEKEQKKHEKEVEKEQKELEKEEKKKHHGGLFGFLHRDKDKDEEKTAEHDDKHHRHEKEAGAVAAGAAGAAAYDHHEHDKHERSRLHKDPPADYVAKAHEGEYYGTEGRTGEPGAVSSLQETHPDEYGAVRSGEQEGVVTEPHTGLPMNVGKYGSGAGGTDGNEAIQGFRGYDAGTEASGPNAAYQSGAQGGTMGPDWQNVKKSNTPY
ncbi:hypothetical protein DBV05_g8331 [Lasiodiplodia theobromae]|uniref:Uncharacterized protein n=1 Tax=Lasiodiplodia theobromae TaxID=45133 RepID=A0A5N5D6G8_9PEZI|nr:hypothetical protein DBV05_g8331 [Lasiodiplodia theobromae]